MGWASLRSVNIGEGDEKPVADAQDQASEIHDAFVLSANLDGAAKRCEEACEPEGRLAPEEVSETASSQRGEEGAQSEQRANQLLERSL